MQGGLVIIGVASLALTAFASFADRRRMNRSNPEAVGFMPWPLISILGVTAALFAFALAIKFSV